MRRLLGLAMRVEGFAKLADSFLLGVSGGREWEWIEARSDVVTRIVTNAHPTAGSQAPKHVRATIQQATYPGIVYANRDTSAIDQVTWPFEKQEGSMLGYLACG